MRVAIVHYWLVNWRGGEKVLKAIAETFPEADIFTHVLDPALASEHFPGRKISTTFISRLPLARRFYQKYLPLMPMALEHLDLREYELVISCESGPAKGVIVAPSAMHICYCHSPMRYLWDMYHEYRVNAGALTNAVMVPALHYLRNWDQLSAQRVDHYVANSRFVAARIRKYYRRRSHVIHPPVAVRDFDDSRPSEDFYLFVGQLVPYKRADLVVAAFNKSGKPLVIVGEGEMSSRLQKDAGPNISFLGRQPFESLRDQYARCRAVVFPGIEDFGIVPVEAMASGKPVIALAAGGALETVIDGVTGVLFQEASVPSLLEAIERFEVNSESFDSATIRAHAFQFSEEVFKTRFETLMRRVLP